MAVNSLRFYVSKRSNSFLHVHCYLANYEILGCKIVSVKILKEMVHCLAVIQFLMLRLLNSLICLFIGKLFSLQKLISPHPHPTHQASDFRAG